VVLPWALALGAGYALYRLAVPRIDNEFGHWRLDCTTSVASVVLGNFLQRRLLAKIDADGALRHRALSFGANAED
jgi:hypothetical protein